MHRSVSVSVWSEGEGSALDKFDEHIVDEPDEVESDNQFQIRPTKYMAVIQST